MLDGVGYDYCDLMHENLILIAFAKINGRYFNCFMHSIRKCQ